jgi:hypothetical protein
MRGRLDWSYITSMTVFISKLSLLSLVDLLPILSFTICISLVLSLYWQFVMRNCHIMVLCISVTWYDLLFTRLDPDLFGRRSQSA